MGKVKKAKYIYKDGYYVLIGEDDEAREAAQSALDVAESKADIDDETVSDKTTYSSEKIEAIVGSALYFQNVAVAARTGDIVSINNAKITDSHVVAECVFAKPSAINSDVTWTTADGSFVLNGTCTAATTANIVLVKKNN